MRNFNPQRLRRKNFSSSEKYLASRSEASSQREGLPEDFYLEKK